MQPETVGVNGGHSKKVNNLQRDFFLFTPTLRSLSSPASMTTKSKPDELSPVSNDVSVSEQGSTGIMDQDELQLVIPR